MTDAEHAFWESYLRSLADLLGLRDWDVRLKRDSCGDDNGGSSFVWYGQKRATVRLNPAVFAGRSAFDRAEQRRIVAHELLHCHWEYADEAVRLAFKDSDDPRDLLFAEYYRRGAEIALDGIATAVAELLPLPGGAP